jgi:sugar phosphate isomerase/epimerase
MIDFIEVLRTLERGGYSGPLSVELEFQGDPWPPLGEVDEAMQRSLEFIHECELSVSEVEEGDREAQ